MLHVHDGYVSLASWNAFLKFSDLKARWDQGGTFDGDNLGLGYFKNIIPAGFL